jgi:N-acyl-D-aspartate/D-glutamate deacylase
MKQLWVIVLLCIGAGVAAAPHAASAQAYDVLIRGGRVLDGSGNPWIQADVAIRGDRIAAVGNLSEATARTVIDAAGRYVAPGFIDVHSHAGGGLTDDTLSAAEPLLAQGITTVVINPDGGGAVDLAAQRASLLEHDLGVNAAPLVPHGSIRREVMGMVDRAPDAAELDRMKRLVRQGMEEGGFGLSTGPFYAPGSYAGTDEFIALSEVAAEYGGVYQSHIRDESNYTIGLVAAVDEVITIAREAELPGIVTHIKALGPPVWGFSEAVATRIERARSEGVEVFADQYPYDASATSLAAALVPRWAEAGGRDSLVARIRTPESRERMLRDMEANLARRGGADRIQFRTFGPDPSIEGQTLADVASTRGADPLVTALDLIEQENPGIVSFNMNQKDVRRFMQQPWTMTCSDGGLVAMGDGVPHPRNYGAFPRKLRTYVMENEVIGLGFAIRSMTHLSASVMGIADRGLLRSGAYADVVVFDPERLRDTAEFQDPHQLAEGMEHVIVNGQFAVRDGAFTGDRPGRVLHRQQP